MRAVRCALQHTVTPCMLPASQNSMPFPIPMEMLLLVIVLGSLSISALCSLSEAALYSVPMAHVRHLAESGSKAGAVLLRFKDNMTRPISGILILNTIANTAGPSLGAAIVGEIYGDQAVLIFALGMTALVLVLSEIFPKIVGVAFAKPVSRAVALPLLLVISLFSPLIYLLQKFSNSIQPEQDQPTVSRQEVLTMAAMGAEEGTIDDLEGRVIENVIGLDAVLVRDIMTPRVNVFRALEDATLRSLDQELPEWAFTRIPLHKAGDPDQLTGYVRQRDLYREIIYGNRDARLADIARPLRTVSELLGVDKLLMQMIGSKEHMYAVVDEHGSLAGVVTLEDAIEQVVGREISDEYDVLKREGVRALGGRGKR
jgi:CBS domain containing-hemolysin-like protein